LVLLASPKLHYKNVHRDREKHEKHKGFLSKLNYHWQERKFETDKSTNVILDLQDCKNPLTIFG
jgi:hypothetical protein